MHKTFLLCQHCKMKAEPRPRSSSRGFSESLPLLGLSLALSYITIRGIYWPSRNAEALLHYHRGFHFAYKTQSQLLCFLSFSEFLTEKPFQHSQEDMEDLSGKQLSQYQSKNSSILLLYLAIIWQATQVAKQMFANEGSYWKVLLSPYRVVF